MYVQMKFHPEKLFVQNYETGLEKYLKNNFRHE